MVRANGANTNSEIRIFFAPFFHRIRQPKDRRSMHPSRPQEADWVARWPGTSAGHAGAANGGRARAALPAAPASIPTWSCMRTGHGGGPTRPAPTGEFRWAQTPANPAGVSATGAVKDHAQGFLVRINDVVDEPFVRRRMKHQENHRPLRPIIQRHRRRDTVRPVHFRRDGLDPTAVLLTRQRIGVEHRKLLVVLHRRRPRLVEGRRKVSVHERGRRIVEDRTPTAIVIQRSQRLHRGNRNAVGRKGRTGQHGHDQKGHSFSHHETSHLIV
jgi:hypothetical protein